MLTRFWNRRRLAALTTMALGVAGVSTVAWGATDQDGATAVDSAVAEAMGAPTTAVAAVPEEVRDRFAVFRNRPASGMPAEAAAMVGSSQRFGRNAQLARAIDTVTGTGWVIPGDGYVCIAIKDPVDGYGTSCVPTEVAAIRGLRIQLGGVFPDGQVAATVVLPDGAQAVGPDGVAVATRDGVASVLTPGIDQLAVAP